MESGYNTMTQVEDIAGLAELIQEENIQIVNRINGLNQSAEINEILKISLPQLEDTIEEKNRVTLNKIVEMNTALTSILSRSESLSTSQEVSELFIDLKNRTDNFHNELFNQHKSLEVLSQRLNEIQGDKTDRDAVVDTVMLVKADVENLNRSLEASVIGLNSSLQNILKHLLTMDTTEQNDIIKRELENIFLSTNALLSSLEISDRKNDEMFNMMAVVENNVNTLVNRDPERTVNAINEIKNILSEKFERASAEFSLVGDSFKMLSVNNLQQILTDIEKSSSKIDEVSQNICDSVEDNISSVKKILENIAIDNPKSSEENPVLSAKLNEILSSVQKLSLIDSSKDNVDENINVLKDSLQSVKLMLAELKENSEDNTAEKLADLEMTLADSIHRYEEGMLSLNNRFNEYVAAVYKLGEVTDTKLDDSAADIIEVKLQLKDILDTLVAFNSKSETGLKDAIDMLATDNEVFKSKLDVDSVKECFVNTLSALDVVDKKNEDIRSAVSSIDNKMENLLQRDPDCSVNAINSLKLIIDERFDKTFSEIAQVSASFGSLSEYNLQRILSDIEKSSSKIDEVSQTLCLSVEENILSVKHVLENIAIDNPKSSEENPVLSAKLNDILNAIQDISLTNTSATNVDSNIEVLKDSLLSIGLILEEIKNTPAENSSEKLIALESTLAENIQHYDEHMDVLNNRFKEYITAIYKLNDLAESKFEDSSAEIVSIKLELKNIIELLNSINTKTDSGLSDAVSQLIQKSDVLAAKLDVDSVKECFVTTLSVLENNDKKGEEALGILTSVDEKVSELINRNPELPLSEINSLRLFIDEKIERNVAEVSKIADSFQSISNYNFQQILADIEKSSLKMDEISHNISSSLVENISMLKRSLDDIAIDNPKVPEENPALSAKLNEILNAVNTSILSRESESDADENIVVLKNALFSIEETLSGVKNKLEDSTSEKIVSLQTTLAESIQHYDEHMADLNARFKEYASAICKLSDITEQRFDDSVKEFADLKVEIKDIKEILINSASKSDSEMSYTLTELKNNADNISTKIDEVEENLRLDGSHLKEKLDNLNNTLIERASIVDAKFGELSTALSEVNSSVKLDVDSVRECFDSALSALDIVRSDILDNVADSNEILTGIVNQSSADVKEMIAKSQQQEEFVNSIKSSVEKNTEVLDEITSNVKNIENSLLANANEYKQMIEEKSLGLKQDIDVIQSILSDSTFAESDEKIIAKLSAVEALISESADKYDEKVENLTGTISNYIRSVQQNSEEAEIRLGNSIAEIAEIKEDLQKFSEEINSVNTTNDKKLNQFYEILDDKISVLIKDITSVKDAVQKESTGSFNETLLQIDAKFAEVFAALKDAGEDDSLNVFSENLSAVKQELNLVNTDLKEVLDAKTSAILEGFGPVREAVSQILDFDFNQIITEVKTQVELSYLNLSSDLNSSLTMSQEAVSKLETVFREVAKKIDSIDEQVTEFSRNKLEVLSLTVENINRIVEKNLEAINAIPEDWKDGIIRLEDKITAESDNCTTTVKTYINNLQDEITGLLNSNLDEFKTYISIMRSDEDILHSLDILKSDLANRIEVLSGVFKEEIEKFSDKDEKLQSLSTDLKAHMGSTILNFAKHIEASSVKSLEIKELIDGLKADLNKDISDVFKNTLESFSAVVQSAKEDLTIDMTLEMGATANKLKTELVDGLSKEIDELTNSITVSGSKVQSELQNVRNNIQISDEKVHKTLQALHDKVDILAMADGTDEDLLYEIEDIKEILNKVSDNSQLAGLLKEINKIQENSSKNADDIKESVLSAIISVFDQISFVEETEDIKDFVEEKTGEINQHLLEVRNQLKQIGVGDSFDYSYTLQDVESDIAKLRIILNDISQSTSSDDVLDILNNVHRIASSVENLQSTLTSDQAYGLKSDFEKLSEDIVSISTRTNKILLTSDESYRVLNNGLSEFSNIIQKLENRISYLDNTKISEQISHKLDNITSVVSVIANSGKVMNEAMMYLGEWVDTTTENIGAISERTAEIDEIKDIITDLRMTMPSKASILNELEDRFEEQQQRINRLEMKFDRMLSLLEDRDDSKLDKKLERIEKQLSKLGVNVEKLASYVDE